MNWTQVFCRASEVTVLPEEAAPEITEFFELEEINSGSEPGTGSERKRYHPAGYARCAGGKSG